ncbi:retrovirus-related pol polyprotein from transposon TNT 1-94 [Tanacetum coccineum]
MDLETAQTNTNAKFPLLKQGEYDMWKLRIEQYFQVQDYALWDVIENGNSFKPAAQTTTNADGSSTTLIPGPVTADEKTQKKNDVKARSMLLMALPNEHLLTFNQYKDAKTLFAAIQTRFGGNDATKKTQKTLLKQMYENFSAPSTESLDSIFNRLQKIVSQLAILGENISQEDLNLKFLRSLPSEWNTHVVVWRNKPDLDTMSFDDLYNNFKIVEQEVKGTASSSSSSSSQNLAFMSSTSSTNEVNTAYGVSTANTQVSTASTQVSTANLSDDTVYAFLASQPNGSQLVHEDLEQIHEDDLEEMDLKWQLALLSMRTRKFFQKTGRKITINGSDTAGYDKSKVECFNCHKLGHFARECRGPRNQDNRSRNQDSSRRTINVEEISSKAMLAIDGAGFDWSFMADKEVPSDMALMAFSDSKPKFEGYGPKISKSVSEDISNEVKKSPDALLVEELVSDVDNFEKKTVFPTKIEFVNQQEKPVRKPTNCNYHQKERVVSGSNYTGVNYNYSAQKTHPSAQRNMVPRAILMKNSLRTLNTVRPVNTAHPRTTVYSARPMSCFSKSAQSTVNVVKASACWVGRPTKLNSASITFKRHNYVDARGKSKHMTKNMSYLSNIKDLDGGYVTFGRGTKGGRITGKGILKTGKLDFEDVYFVKEVPRKNNMYSVDMKNIVPKESLTCLVAKVTLDESMLWHRRLEFKNRVMSEFYEKKGIKREFKVAKTPQQNGVVERRNRTLIKATRTMLADSKLPTTFCAEAVNIACYVQNRVLVVKPHNQTPYELFRGRTPALRLLGIQHCRTRKVEENLHVRFLEDKPIVAIDGPKWLFDIDVLTKLMNYVSVVAGTNSNDFVDGLLFNFSSKNANNDEPQPSNDAGKKDDEGGINNQERPEKSAQDVNTTGPSINTASTNDNTGSLNINTVLSTPNTRIHKDHSLDNVIGDVQSNVQTRRMTKTINDQGFISVVYEGKTHEDLHTCLLAYFLSYEEPKRIAKALSDSAWVEAMQEELLQNKKDERGIVIRNKARLVARGYTQEEGIDYDEVFALVARIKAIRLFLAYASFMGFMVYQMDVKSAFLYGKIEEEVYVCQPSGFEDPNYPDKVYRVVKALYGLHQAPRAWYKTLAKYLLGNGFHRGNIDQTLFIKKQKRDILLVQMSSMGELTFFLGLQVKQKEDGIFISRDKYVADILRKFGFTDVRTASTPMDTEKPLLKDSDGDDVDVHLYRSMIGSLMYLTSSRLNIMFAVCACARF